jgi:hypothetical protein
MAWQGVHVREAADVGVRVCETGKGVEQAVGRGHAPKSEAWILFFLQNLRPPRVWQNASEQ